MRKKSKYYYASLFVIVIFFSFLIYYLYTTRLEIQGDGNEYILQTVAFQNHLSFGIHTSDLDQAKSQFYNHQDSLQRTFDYIVHDERGVAYSNHFGAYSALATFVKIVLIFLNIYALWAFSITNYFLWLSAALVVFFCLKTDDKRKFCILIMILINPVFFYLNWVHTEVYIFAFEVIGLVFLYNRQHSFSILALSVAAMQNLGILPLAAIAGLDYIFECFCKYKENSENCVFWGFVQSYWKKIVPYSVFYIPAFLPMATTYARFGTYNLVAKIAMENKYILHKALDYVFDLNLGILPYEPIILICFMGFIICGIKKLSRNAILNLAGVVGMLFIIAHQLQINSGMQEIMRYCVWIIPVLVFYVVMNWTNQKKKNSGLFIVSIVEAAFTGLLISYCTWGGGGYTNGQFAPWTKILLDKMPQIYNPSHGIFYSRVSGVETYDSPFPAVYTNKNGYVRKILLSEEAKGIFYSDDWKLANDEGDLIDKTGLSTLEIDEGDYIYVNVTGNVKCVARYTLGDMIYFYSDEYNAPNYVQKGFSFKEDWGSWTDGTQLNMKKMLIEDDAELINADIDISGVFYHPQNVQIFVNNEKVYAETITGDQDIHFVFQKPENNIVDISILLPDAIAPSDIMESSDDRKLGLGLLTMQFTKADNSLSMLP